MYQTVTAPLITFVVPAYNAVSTLEAAVRSLSEQTSDDWEAIIVDDGSVDGTGKMADALARGDDRIKVLHQGNAGVSAARNAAIAAASGEYLAFLDVDDTVVPNFVEKAGSLLGRRPVRPDVVALAYRALPQGTVFGYGRFLGNASEFLELSLGNRYATFPCWLFLVSARLIAASGVRFTVGRRTGEDQEFILKLLCCASICESVEDSDVYYLYRMPSGGSAMGLNLEGQFDYPRAMRDVLCFAAKPDAGMSPDGLEAVDRLLTDRFVGACAYAAETAFSNGASDSDVLSWLTDSLEGFDCHGALENGCCRSENRRFLRLWLGCSGMIPLYIRFGLYIRSIGRTIKYWISRRGTR